jgi:hypothetical protein
VTVTPVASSNMSSLKGIILPTHPLPPEQALGEDLMGGVSIHVKETKTKKIKSENNSEANFVKCEYCDYCCDKVNYNILLKPLTHSSFHYTTEFLFSSNKFRIQFSSFLVFLLKLLRLAYVIKSLFSFAEQEVLV